jgi:hypothetical protein
VPHGHGGANHDHIVTDIAELFDGYAARGNHPPIFQPEKKMKIFDEYTSVANHVNQPDFFLDVTQVRVLPRLHSLTLDLESDVAVGENFRHHGQVQPLAIFRRHGE